MNMKRIASYIIMGIAAVSLASCDGFLDKAPKLSQSTDLTLSTYDGLNKSVLGAYEYLASTGWYGGERVLESEMRSGNGIKHADHNSNRYMTNMNWNYTADATSSMWAYGYITIARCNNVIDNLEGKETSDVTAQDLNNLKAEALFLRALCHFDMVTLYAQPYTYVKNNANALTDVQKLGIPYVIHTDPDARPARDGVLDVYAKIADDLVEAEKVISPKYSRAGVADPKAAANIYAIQALLSRVYLYMGEWQKAADYATKVIDSGAFSLWEAKDYVDAWTADKGGSEVIFEVYIDLTNYSNEDCSYMTFPDGAYGDCITSPALYALYEDGDIRKDTYIQDKNETAGLWWTTKYKGKGLSTPDASNTVVLRLSEMYLNRAEAIVNGAAIPGVTASADLNAITSKRGATAYPASVGHDAYRTERRKELAWEGHYFFDLARWGQSVTRDMCYGLTADRANIAFPGFRWALPIPKRELEVNENLVQNDQF